MSQVRRARARAGGRLTVVGTGIRVIAQVTPESASEIERAERLLYLVADPVTEEWLCRLNPQAESLSTCYRDGESRDRAYRRMVDRMLVPVREGRRVCVAFYGHPGVFVQPGHRAIKIARREGFPARMLPGISAEDCLFADLGLDPAEQGCQSFEATDFLSRRRRFDPSSALILWQVGAIGDPGVSRDQVAIRSRLAALTDLLKRHYPPGHRIILYEAAQLPICDPVMKRTILDRLPRAKVDVMASLYIPARRR